jgi:hypothetical protein
LLQRYIQSVCHSCRQVDAVKTRSKRLLWDVNVTRMGETQNSYRIFARKPRKRLIEGQRIRCQENWMLGKWLRFHVPTVGSTKMTDFRDITPRSLVGVDRRFRYVYCLYHQVERTGKCIFWALWCSWLGFWTSSRKKPKICFFVLFILLMEAIRTSETSVYFHETTRRYILEGCHCS